MKVYAGYAGGASFELNILAVDGGYHTNTRSFLKGFEEAVSSLILNEGVKGTHNAYVGFAAHLISNVFDQPLSNFHTRFIVVDTDEGTRGRYRYFGVDGYDRYLGFLRSFHGRSYAIDIDSQDDDGPNFLSHKCFDGTNLLGGVVLSIYDNQVDTLLSRSFLSPVINLIEKEGLEVDGHQPNLGFALGESQRA